MLAIGTIVRAGYKSGEYIGEIVEGGEAKAAVKVLAVLKHPEQGNLHHPGSADVGFFHQRRALAFGEIALMPLHTLAAYSHAVPEYRESLHHALQRQLDELRETIRYAQRAVQELEQLERDYFPGGQPL
ncbi:sporulation phosphorelay system protein KapB [Paenibacillus cymbidii]|uniref:sporulation phosphorelay system protein KapB n=1 Tax=Paenibacillus cymbidii TaxID=1639034 RepID=UPI0010814A7F|nr:sporulation phosphorelay system protein KapB [Paenibacillus cymbidii]